MGDLTANLSRHEFACPCLEDCGYDTVDIETAKVIQDVCNHFKCRVLIHSGCRCFEYNRTIGSTDGSQHPRCRAGDCDFVGVEPGLVHAYVCAKYPGYGFGVYDNFNHIDTRTNGPARWDERALENL